jgi:HEAT repeat protein
MKCEHVREQIPELIAGRLEQAERDKVVEHLEGCAGCRGEVAELNTVWRGMENLNDPADAKAEAAAKARFLEAVHAYQSGLEAGLAAPKAKIIGFPNRPAWRAAIAAGLLAGGILLGRFAMQPAAPNPEMMALRGQVESLRQMVALSLLQQASPSARMRGVTYSEQMAQPDSQVAQALLEAIKTDPSISVRLAAVDALPKFAGERGLVAGIVGAIPGQESPMVQIELIEMLAQLNAVSAKADLARMAKDERLDEAVRQRAAWAIGKLEAGK